MYISCICVFSKMTLTSLNDILYYLIIEIHAQSVRLYIKVYHGIYCHSAAILFFIENLYKSYHLHHVHPFELYSHILYNSSVFLL